MRVLLADDSAVTRRLFEAVITACGHDVAVVEDGCAAWQAFERDPASLVVLDWLMPGLDGPEVCRRIRSSPASGATFVLLVTGRDSSDDLAFAIAAGADDVIAKPVTPETLRTRLAVIERRMEHGQ